MPVQSTDRARDLRRNATSAERTLWRAIRNRQLYGYRFIRQYSIDQYIVDFCCRDRRLIIELDGGQHAEATDYDRARDDHLRDRGYTVLRFWNAEVMRNIPGVLHRISENLDRSSRVVNRPSL